MHLNTVTNNADASGLTLVIDESRSYQGRRMLLRDEVEAWKEREKDSA